MKFLFAFVPQTKEDCAAVETEAPRAGTDTGQELQKEVLLCCLIMWASAMSTPCVIDAYAATLGWDSVMHHICRD